MMGISICHVTFHTFKVYSRNKVHLASVTQSHPVHATAFSARLYNEVVMHLRSNSGVKCATTEKLTIYFYLD